MKKATSLLLTFLMVVSIFVMNIDTVSAASSIKSVTVTGVKQPVEGEHPDYSDIKVTTVPEGAAEIVDMQWSLAMHGPLSDDDTFVAGKDYYISFIIKPKSGYSFEFNEYYNYNGKAEIEGFILNFAEQPPLDDPSSLYLDCKTVKAEKYVPRELTADQFLMYADDVFAIKDRGIVLTGRVLNGSVNVGDKIMVTYFDGTNAITEEMTAEAISMFGKSLDCALKGDNIGLLIGMPFGTNSDGSINRGNIKIGTVVQGTNSTIPPVTEMVGRFELYTADNGGTSTPIKKNCEVNALVGTSDVFCKFLDLNGDAIQPGKTRQDVTLGDFYHGVVVYKGQEIPIRINGKTIGKFTVGEREVITSVKVTGVKNPVAGEHPDYSGITLTTVPADAAKIVEVCWKDIYFHDLPANDTFIEGEIYLIWFTIRPKTGYRFEFDEDIQYNGEAAIEGYTVDYSEERYNEAGSLYLDTKYIVAVSPYLCGDVDLDGVVSITDATYIQMHLAKLKTLDKKQLDASDTDADGSVTITDATYIQMYLAKLIDHLG